MSAITDAGKPNVADCVQRNMGRRRGLPLLALVIELFTALLLTVAAQAQNSQALASSNDVTKTVLAKVDVPASSATSDMTWKDKQIPEWSEADAKQLLADSPWAKKSTVAVDKTLANKTPSKLGRQGGFGLGSIGLGRHRGSNGGNASDNGNSATSSSSGAAGIPDAPLVVTLRWASALPIREAELKAPDTRAPMVDEEHYAIEIYGLPSKQVKNDSKTLADQLKAKAAIKRLAKDDLKPSSVEIVMRDDGPVLVYLFPRKAEITWRDHEINFEAEVGNLKIKQAFQADDMKFHGALEL
jgi:hypothetical protein